ncbi:MAG: class I SAM-dependent methyltransferase, partial [Candidatus Dormibacteria bacterium]
AQRVGPAGRVIGVDIADGMVAATLADMGRRGVQNAEVRVMDAEHLSFADAEFDRVLCGFGIMFFPAVERAMAEAYRVTRPGGCIAISTWVGNGGERWRFVTELAESIVGTSRTLDGRWESAQGLGDLLAEAGCAQVSIVEEAHSFPFSSPQEWWQWMWSQGQRFYLEKMNEEDRERFKHTVFERLKLMERNDELRLDQRMRLALGRRA